MTRHANPRAYAIVRRGESAGPLAALPSHAWWSELRRELSAVAIAVDHGTGRLESEIRAALTVTVLDPSWRAEVEACVEMLVLQLAAAELDHPIATRVRDLDVIAPAPGWVDRAVERAEEAGLFDPRRKR